MTYYKKRVENKVEYANAFNEYMELPDVLFKHHKLKNLQSESKLLYCYILDLHKLQKYEEGYIGGIPIVANDVAFLLQCDKSKIPVYLKELGNAKLIYYYDDEAYINIDLSAYEIANCLDDMLQ